MHGLCIIINYKYILHLYKFSGMKSISLVMDCLLFLRV